MSDAEINSISAMLEGKDAPAFIVFIKKLSVIDRKVSHRNTLNGDTRKAFEASLRADTYEQILKLKETISQCFAPDGPSAKQSR